jgi:hypothetical protein
MTDLRKYGITSHNKVECYEEWMEMINKNFPVVEVKGFMIKDFVSSLGMSFFKNVVTHKGLNFQKIEYKMFVFKTESYVNISGLLCEKFQLLRPGITMVPLPIQPLY